MGLSTRDLVLAHPGQPPLLSGAGLDLRPGDRLAIFGVVVGLVRSYRR